MSGETESPQITAIPSDSLNSPPARHTLKSADAVAIQNTPPTTFKTNSAGKIGHRRKRRFLWKIVAFTCSKSCGGGIQSPIIRCVRENPLRVFVMKKCAHLQKPVISDSLMKCNTQACPGFWRVSNWTTCNCLEHREVEYQTREVKCVQELSTGTIMHVPDGACFDIAPISVQKCECKTFDIRKKPNKFHSIKHRPHKATHSNSIDNTNTHKSKHVIDTNPKRSGVWLASSWNEHCSTTCGEGVQYRSLFCDRSLPNFERCGVAPQVTRQCVSDQSCNVGTWFVGPWSHCSGDCFNLTQTRQVFCITKAQIVDDFECKATDKPNVSQYCSTNEIDDCKPRWHYSEWTNVSNIRKIENVTSIALVPKCTYLPRV